MKTTITIQLDSNTNFTLKVVNGLYTVEAEGDYTINSNTPKEAVAVEKKKEEVIVPTYSRKELKAFKTYTDKTIVSSEGKPVVIANEPRNNATYSIADFTYTDDTIVYFIEEKSKTITPRKPKDLEKIWDMSDYDSYIKTYYHVYKDAAKNLNKYDHLNIVAAQVEVLVQTAVPGDVIINTELETPKGDYYTDGRSYRKEADQTYRDCKAVKQNNIATIAKYLTGTECFKISALGTLKDFASYTFTLDLITDTKASAFRFKQPNNKQDQYLVY